MSPRTKNLLRGLAVVLAGVAVALALFIWPRPPRAPKVFASTPDARAAVVKANDAFAVDLYRKLTETAEGNLAFSPLSLSTALSMAGGGARGETEAAMAKALRLSTIDQSHHEALASLLSELTARHESNLLIANRLWADRKLRLRPEFLALQEEVYGAPAEQLDFADASTAAATINRWVEERTRSRIKDLVSAGDFNADSSLVLSNAIFFKGSWVHPFKPEDTAPGPFWTGKKDVEAVLMQQTADFRYFEDADCQVLQMAYRGGLAMVLLVPRERDGLADLEKTLSAVSLAALLPAPNAHIVRVEVVMPRFTVSEDFRLREALEALGLRIAFTRNADFSGITEQGAFLGQVLHKAVVEVNEEGTTAAAATHVMTNFGSNAAPPPLVAADHPFLFLIRDPVSGALLFMGRVVMPEVAEGLAVSGPRARERATHGE
jgi:serpin B